MNRKNKLIAFKELRAFIKTINRAIDIDFITSLKNELEDKFFINGLDNLIIKLNIVFKDRIQELKTNPY